MGKGSAGKRKGKGREGKGRGKQSEERHPLLSNFLLRYSHDDDDNVSVSLNCACRRLTIPITFLPTIITGSIARSATRRYLIYSEADFEVFRPTGATRCTDWGEIWHRGGPKVPFSVPNFTPIFQIFV